MKSLYTPTKVGLVALILLLSATANVQKIKTSHSQNQIFKGHGLYKKSKIYDSRIGPLEDRPTQPGDRAADRFSYEFELLKDPHTGKIPEEIREKEIRFSKRILVEKSESSARRSDRWTSRGPFNVGGRTRALALDLRDENVILAAGVSGGLWRSQNGGESWREVTDNAQPPSITCIAQDPRPGRHHIWYYGTGERSGNSANAPGAFYTGNGIYRSVDGGRSFRLLESTADNNVNSTAPFDLISNIAVHPKTGHVYVSTFNGVYKSENGRNEYREVLAGGFDNWTDILITPEGILYASIESSGTPNNGIFTSVDGETWTKISPDNFPTAFGRTVMAYTPSDENIIYTFSQNPAGLGHLWRYTANADSTESSWVDLSVNLPNIGGLAGSLNTQGNYNLVVKVHPTQPEVVFIGGTNLYRSFTGFTTPAGPESWIGGYALVNNFSVYPDHHPDQHALLFYPSDPNKALSGNDGGVQVTNNILAENPGLEPVDWVSLNNGYVTTQPYAVAFDPEGSDGSLVAGFQDNGTWFTSDLNPTTPWIEDFGGDGSFNAIADNGKTRYVSSQLGNIFRFNFDDAGNFASFARVTPALNLGFLFVAPFILDPINDNIMYLPSGNTMFRNNNLDEIPLFSNAQATKNWVQIPEATVGAGVISALDISKYPEANKLYYGTSAGEVFRIDNANIDGQPSVNLTAGKGLPAGYVINVTVNPSNSDEVFIVYSNYGIPSIFHTDDAGETWTDISTNLEENPDGSGNGPSVRWLAVSGKEEGYYVGTSTGLYFAYRINGKKTYWFRVSRFEIGNAVVRMVKTRKDGFIAAATHGNGLFSTKTRVMPRPEPQLFNAFTLDDYVVAMNAPDTVINIEGLFEHKQGRTIDLSFTNSNPDLVTAVLNDNKLSISYTSDLRGEATIAFTATSGIEQVAEGFTITVAQPAIYAQVGTIVGSRPSQFFSDFNALVQVAADFSVPANTTWAVDRVLAFGVANGSPLFNDAVVVIYEDDGGAPGNEVFNSGPLTVSSVSFDPNLELTLTAPVVLSSGDYWISVYANLAFNPGARQWFWSTQSEVIGNEGSIIDQSNLFGLGLSDWTPVSAAFGGAPTDQVFQIFGKAGAAGGAFSNLAEAIPDMELNEKLKGYAIWPNPSGNVFNIRFKPVEQDFVELLIHDLNGAQVYKNDQIKAVNSTLTWDATNYPKGIYFVHMVTNEGRQTFKLIKQ
ncbi:T9SS type A sorting domain-containing protein [Fulvivirgaceae bacterium BMA12]|uniref:T9SS type A sorting domain-containing protein n=1 Tax=Agaribacillus aureus TaxID=3051825 RepID=A0ABT8L824_9BACT|nr:T9SS type A sorting domain-containing protein [Fulvivirgaceae bacterium BMA12]